MKKMNGTKVIKTKEISTKNLKRRALILAGLMTICLGLGHANALVCEPTATYNNQDYYVYRTIKPSLEYQITPDIKIIIRGDLMYTDRNLFKVRRAEKREITLEDGTTQEIFYGPSGWVKLGKYIYTRTSEVEKIDPNTKYYVSPDLEVIIEDGKVYIEKITCEIKDADKVETTPEDGTTQEIFTGESGWVKHGSTVYQVVTETEELEGQPVAPYGYVLVDGVCYKIVEEPEEKTQGLGK